jgi:hypothetical protein
MGTAISGINNQDLICGRYTDFAGIRHGFAVCRINAQSELRGQCDFLFASLLYPQLDFTDVQSRTDSGVLIRDMIFYNNRLSDFLKDIDDFHRSGQIVFERCRSRPDGYGF